MGSSAHDPRPWNCRCGSKGSLKQNDDINKTGLKLWTLVQSPRPFQYEQKCGWNRFYISQTHFLVDSLPTSPPRSSGGSEPSRAARILLMHTRHKHQAGYKGFKLKCEDNSRCILINKCPCYFWRTAHTHDLFNLCSKSKGVTSTFPCSRVTYRYQVSVKRENGK